MTQSAFGDRDSIFGRCGHQQILLIDDSQSAHKLVCCLLGDEPIAVHSAYDAQAGLEMAESLRPDLIMLDVEMPEIDGFETCRRLKANPATSGIPILFLTARAATEELALGFNLGANDYMIKPFDVTELRSRIRASLRTGRLIRLLEQKALLDPLTGLGTRAMFDERVAAEVALRVRSRNPLACILVDVDRFKQINDKYGPSFGDYVLSRIADALNKICRLSDIACRREGDEFAILTPLTSGEQATLLAERMRAAVATLLFSSKDESVAVTCSFGVAEAAGTYDRLMLDRAEQALLHSKVNGRNRIFTASKHPVPRTALA